MIIGQPQETNKPNHGLWKLCDNMTYLNLISRIKTDRIFAKSTSVFQFFFLKSSCELAINGGMFFFL